MEYTPKDYPTVTLKYVGEDGQQIGEDVPVDVDNDGSYEATVEIPEGYVQDGKYATAADGGKGTLDASQIPATSVANPATHGDPAIWSAEDPATAEITGDVTFNVEYTPKVYTITVIVVEGSNEPTTIEYKVKHDREHTFTFPSKTPESVEVDGSSASLTSNSYTFRNVTADHTIKVTYAAPATTKPTIKK